MSATYKEINNKTENKSWFSFFSKDDGNGLASETTSLQRKDTPLQKLCKRLGNDINALIIGLNEKSLVSHYAAHPIDKILDNDLLFLARKISQLSPYKDIDYLSIFATNFYMNKKDDLSFNVQCFRALLAYDEKSANKFYECTNLEGKISQRLFNIIPINKSPLETLEAEASRSSQTLGQDA